MASSDTRMVNRFRVQGRVHLQRVYIAGGALVVCEMFEYKSVMKQVNSPHGVISSGHYSSTGLGVKRIVRFVETMIVDYPSLHFLVRYIILDGNQQKYEHFNTLGKTSYSHLSE